MNTRRNTHIFSSIFLKLEPRGFRASEPSAVRTFHSLGRSWRPTGSHLRCWSAGRGAWRAGACTKIYYGHRNRTRSTPRPSGGSWGDRGRARSSCCSPDSIVSRSWSRSANPWSRSLSFVSRATITGSGWGPRSPRSKRSPGRLDSGSRWSFGSRRRARRSPTPLKRKFTFIYLFILLHSVSKKNRISNRVTTIFIISLALFISRHPVCIERRSLDAQV